ncbi:hypothetical protein C7974DRAFT_394305, partial [Boeremia exigua]|uniref:uncharacterized protein n=1 Tax=Boeremia exigua TaxID=749465 RepID=UPI001E8E60C6
MQRGRDNATNEQVRRLHSVETRHLTSKRLKEQGLHIPSSSRSSSRRKSSVTGEHGDLSWSEHDGVERADTHGGINEAESHSDSDESYSSASSINEASADPFVDGVELRSEITQLRQQLANVKGLLNQAKTELALEQSRRPTVYDDAYFVAQLDNLRQEIQSWTITYFSTGKGHYTQRTRRRFEVVSDDWASYMEDANFRPWLIQARIWHTLLQRLFDSDSSRRHRWLYTGAKDGVSVDETLERAASSSTIANRMAFSEWRASTFALLFPGKGSAIDPAPYLQQDLDEHVTDVMKDLWRPLWNYAERGFSKEHRSEAKRWLREIISAAFYLDLDVKKHSTDLWFTSKNLRIRSAFDSRDMEDKLEQTGKGYVRLVVSPPLYKETIVNQTVKKILLRKAQVCTSTLERLPRSNIAIAMETFYTPESNHSRLEQGTSGYAHPSRSHTSSRRLGDTTARDGSGRRS